MKATVERNCWRGETVIIGTTVVLVVIIIIIMSILELFIYVMTQQANGQLECTPEYCNGINK